MPKIIFNTLEKHLKVPTPLPGKYRTVPVGCELLYLVAAEIQDA